MSDINTLREHLFAALQGLQDKEKPMEIERAKAICEVSQVIINSAKVEIDFLRANGSVETRFFERPTLDAGRSAPASALAHDDNDPDEDAVSAFGDHETATGTVSVDIRNGQRVVTHRLK